jgi:hypothetical protein
VGLSPGDLAPRFQRICAERAIISVPGTVEAVTGSDETRMVPGIEEVFLRTEPGQEVVFPANNVQKCGNVIAVGEDRAEARAAAQYGVAAIWIRLKPLEERTTGYLFRETGNDAFASVNGAVRSRVAAMPPYRGDPTHCSPDRRILVEIAPETRAGDQEDWYGMTLRQAATLALRRSGGELLESTRGTGFVLSGLFWRAILRGSAQGGSYILQSVREAARRRCLREFLAGI